jgi:mono/diheme cytochrome c family protein
MSACATRDEPIVDSQPAPPDPDLATQGKPIFRFDTFGDETLWTDTLKMHEVIRSSVSPTTALSVGLKVDVDTLPEQVKADLQAGKIDLNDPATTVTLLKLGAVVGLVGRVDANNNLTRVGITCALCHSTVDNSFAPGIGKRLDGWPNRDLDPGAIIALSPAVTESQKAIYKSWGKGKYDPRFNQDKKNFPVVIPPAYGLANVDKATYTGDGDVSYWNRYVSVTQMHAHGSFVDERINVNVQNPPDMVTAKLPALKAYQLSIAKPAPRPGTFDAAAAERGRAVFMGGGQCATCHMGATLTDDKTHTPAEAGQEAFYASRSATKQYRTTPLRGLWQHPPYFHDGSAATLEAVVEHYNTKRSLNLTAQQKADLVQYLKSI